MRKNSSNHLLDSFSRLHIVLLVHPLDVLVQASPLLQVLVLLHQRPALLLAPGGERGLLPVLGQLAVARALVRL